MCNVQSLREKKCETILLSVFHQKAMMAHAKKMKMTIISSYSVISRKKKFNQESSFDLKQI